MHACGLTCWEWAMKSDEFCMNLHTVIGEWLGGIVKPKLRMVGIKPLFLYNNLARLLFHNDIYFWHFTLATTMALKIYLYKQQRINQYRNKFTRHVSEILRKKREIQPFKWPSFPHQCRALGKGPPPQGRRDWGRIHFKWDPKSSKKGR